MRILKFAVLGVILLAVMAVAAAGYGVYYVGSHDMRGLAGWAVAKAGYQAEFGGPVDVKLWPQLEVKVQGLRVPALQGGGELLSVDEAAVKLAWGNGLKPWVGMQVLEVSAQNPNVVLVRHADGSANWLPEGVVQAAEGEAGSGASGGLNIPMLAATKLAVKNLNLTYDDAVSARKVLVKNMNITAATNGSVATTVMDGSVNGQRMNGEIRVDVADGANIPVTAKLNGGGLSLAVDGRVLEQKSFAGLVNAQTGNLKSTLVALLGKAPAQAPADAFQLTGDVQAGPERVVLRNFSTRLGELLKASGDVDVVLGRDGAKPSAKGDVKVQGSNLRALAELATGKAQAVLPTSSFQLVAALSGEDAIEVKDGTFTLGNVLVARGDVRVVPAAAGGQPQVDAKIRAEAGNVRALARAFGKSGTFPEQPLRVVLDVAGKDGSYNLKTFDAVMDGVAKASGKMVVVPGAQLKMDGEVAMEGANMQSAARAFGVAAGSVPASAFHAKAKVAGEGTIKLSDLVVNLPGLLEATGDLDYTPGAPANVRGALDVSRLDATALGYCAVAGGGGKGGSGGGGAAAAGGAPWTDEPINVQGLRNLAVNVQLDVKGLRCAKFPVTAVKAKIVNTPSQLDVSDVVMQLPQGSSADAALVLKHAGTPELSMTLKTHGVPVEELVSTLKAKGVQLPVDLDARLESVGGSTRALARNLGGVMTLNADKGRLPYTDMLGNLVSLQRVLQGAAQPASNGDGSVDNLKANIIVKQGVATIDTLQLATGNGAMNLSGEGAVDIAGWVMDVKLTPKLNAGDGLEIPLLVRGSLSAPQIGADPDFVSKLTGRLAAEGIKGVLGLDKASAKGVGGVVGDVISGKGLTQEGVGQLLQQFTKPKAVAPAQPAAIDGAAPTESAPAAAPAEAPAQVDPAQLLLKGVFGQ